MPANIIHVRTGLTLSEVSEIGLNLHVREIFEWRELINEQALLGLAVLGFVALIPTLLKKKMVEKFD